MSSEDSEVKVTPCKVAVLGAGSYGTAMAYVATHNGHSVCVYARDQKVVDSINKEHVNPKRFSDQKLPDSITASTDMATVLKDAAIVIHSVPAQHTPEFLAKHANLFTKGVPLVSTAKGIHVSTHRLMSEAIPEALGERAKEIPLVYLSGPSFAKEMMKGHPMAVVVAAHKLSDAERAQKLLSSMRFRVYASEDVVGVEVGGALKNPLAIGAGMAQGLGFGQSTIAGLVTRGCREMRQLATALGGKPETLAGLSGVGDLMLTCFSSLSRNNRCGKALAKGKTIEEAFQEIGEVVEGVPTAHEVIMLAEKLKLELPLFRAVDAIISGKLKPKEALASIMGRDLKQEKFY
mmetsp:Transcript_2737/g.3398  ORF Transcript_2737/g.3398 Transcript_2737/m.3398 type:complete len:348 (+) Transcript_2737:42-1085(+)